MFKAVRCAPRLCKLYSSQGANVPSGFWWLVEGKVAALARPKAESDLKFLKGNGVTHLVSLTDKVPDFHGVDLTSVHMPIEGGGMPTVEQAKAFTDTVADINSRGGGVALHCGEGQGRTSVMMACYAVSANKCSAEQAIQEVREKRPGAVGTKEREQRVKEYENMFKQS